MDSSLNPPSSPIREILFSFVISQGTEMIQDLLKGQEAEGRSPSLQFRVSALGTGRGCPTEGLSSPVTRGPTPAKPEALWFTRCLGDSRACESVRCASLGCISKQVNPSLFGIDGNHAFPCADFALSLGTGTGYGKRGT